MSRAHLPIIPTPILQAHRVAEPYDHRFRACARLLQAIWREGEELPIGNHVDGNGVIRELGSRIADGVETGRNFMTREVAMLAWREAIYREPGAVIDDHRLWTNLLSSQPLTFNLFGPLRLDDALATAMLHALCPDLDDASVQAVRFEHSPGRGDPTLTGDYTAFDAAILYRRASGRSGIVAIEVKYSEDCTERQKGLRPACEAAMIATNLYRDASDPALQIAPLQQFTREHVLTQTSVTRGDYDEGRFVVIAPRHNRPVSDACDRYRSHLAEPTPTHVTFETWSIEAFVAAMMESGDAAYADALHRRYLDWSIIDRLIEENPPAFA